MLGLVGFVQAEFYGALVRCGKKSLGRQMKGFAESLISKALAGSSCLVQESAMGVFVLRLVCRMCSGASWAVLTSSFPAVRCRSECQVVVSRHGIEAEGLLGACRQVWKSETCLPTRASRC